ncbi:MAG TPA: hypothetical protein PLC07_07405 [Bacillota bacterium]|nr:hypothetical protein [Bacillota bacterium]HPT86483.1 hypothetical protein [Bacillota bacterium]
MIVIYRRRWIILLFVILFITGFWSAYLYQRSRVKIGEYYIRVNPTAKINPNKQYRLRLWDYRLPLDSEGTYARYLRRAVRDFQKQFPNIQVEIKFLNLLDGEEELRQALVRNEAPDVYASFYSMPDFYYLRQIPVGPFLTKEEKKSYPEWIEELYSIDGTLCSFPRWASVNVWVGNRKWLEVSGIDIAKVQQQGWDWNDVQKIGSRLPKGIFALAGYPITDGFLQTLRESGKRTSEVKAILDLVAGMAKNGKISVKLEHQAITGFIEGKVACLAGIRPLTYRKIVEILADHRREVQVDPVVLPVPRLPGFEEIQVVDGGVINVYRNRYTRGDDHIAAAMALGYFLSTYQDVGPWLTLGVATFPRSDGVAEDLAAVMDGVLQRSRLLKRQGNETSSELMKDLFEGKRSVDAVIEGMNL